MRGLTIIVAAADPDRFHAALSVAAANAALDGRTRIFLQGESAALMLDASSPLDAYRSSSGVPTTQQLLAEAQALGTQIIVCQSGLTSCGMSADRLPDNARTAGLIEILTTLGEDRLVMA